MVLSYSMIIILNVLNISSILNLVADALQRTCTGTINIDLQGSGWEKDSEKVTSSQNSGSSTGDSSGGTGGGGRENPSEGDTTTNTGGKTSTDYEDGETQTQSNNNHQELGSNNLSDNVHFGPAGIGLLIMGFLVLGCKYF